MKYRDRAPIDRVTIPIQRFIKQEKSGGLVLGISVIVALVLANSPWRTEYFSFFDQKFGFTFRGETYLEFSLLQWINDGLMAVFFFMVGLELKREIIAGELSDIKNALSPVIAAIGGSLVPALIYFSLNSVGEVHSGWGIPMATDIAFALGVLYLLGDRIPLSIKVFLTALAIIDDLMAVLVIAFFYTSDISLMNLLIGFLFFAAMFIGNRIGVRSILFYAVLGIGGLWTAFLLSGVHATIAAVIAAFAIPVDVRIKESVFLARMKKLVNRFYRIDPDDKVPTVTFEQLQVLERIIGDTKRATPPSQRLESFLSPLVAFVIIPIFAVANAGVDIVDISPDTLFDTNVATGVALGLFVGKVVGIMGFTWLFIKFGVTSMPRNMDMKKLLGLSFLAAIGFTMSLFITQLAFVTEVYKTQAKVGIFVASIAGGIIGYTILKRQTAPAVKDDVG
ncbi:MAG TPA: Na+/H+ antiporter NhaA [Flavobacteriaceae bacterium]|nr:Na+/H+ antiporter NhaA [Flavobacteriaceae bacterium]